MTIQTTLPASTYAADHAALQAAPNGHGSALLSEVRARGWAKFSDLGGFPTARRGNERWKYTNVTPLSKIPFALPTTTAAATIPAKTSIAAVAPWNEAWTTLTFVDGRYASGLSSAASGVNRTVNVMPLQEAVSKHRPSIEKYLTHVAAYDAEHFTALNTAFVTDGAFIEIPDRAVVERPVHILFLSTQADHPEISHPRILLIAGKESQATVVESYVSMGGGQHFSNAVAEFQLGEGARLEHYRVLMENEESFHIGNTRVRQAAHSGFTSVSFATGPALGRNDVHVKLEAEGAECNLTGLYLTTNKQHMDNNVSVIHEKPHGTSHQYFKGILAGKSHAVFSGSVIVKPGAVKTYADQKDFNLLLSHGAEIDTKPSLEILADDVKCFHGATAGHLDQDTIFYLRSRGIDLQTAMAMLVRGFAGEIVEKVKPAALANYIEEVTARLMPDLIKGDEK